MNEARFHVIVIGGGGAGLAAAIEASEAGARTLLLEKAPSLGGSTALSIGSVTATQTPHQCARGIDDNPADHWADMAHFADAASPPDNDTLRRVLCDSMPGTFRWLLDSGVRFFGPMPEPPHRQPRMHNVLPNSRSFIYHLKQRAQGAGVTIRTGVRAETISMLAGSVCGVRLEGADEVLLTPRGAVILATGDFTNSPEFKRRFMGEQEAKVEGVNQNATGDGQRMAEALGAKILNGELALGPEMRFIAPTGDNFLHRLPPWKILASTLRWSLDHLPQTLLRPFMMKFLTTVLAPSTALFEDGALLINMRGERFADESDRPAWRLPDQPDGMGYILIDGRIARRYQVWPHYISTAPGLAYAFLSDYRRNRPDIYFEAPTLQALAGQLHIDPTSLKQAGTSLNEPPFIALGPVKSVFVHSEGGLRVDNRHRVLDETGKSIRGLFAAGSTGQGGLLLMGHGHHLAWAFTSGRRAGQFAAAAALSETDRFAGY